MPTTCLVGGHEAERRVTHEYSCVTKNTVRDASAEQLTCVLGIYRGEQHFRGILSCLPTPALAPAVSHLQVTIE